MSNFVSSGRLERKACFLVASFALTLSQKLSNVNRKELKFPPSS
uniref:Uncharacterized protein n=1 Tax=Ciona intestinalis TaxID=7719 RepID=H2Y2W7_CIOIN